MFQIFCEHEIQKNDMWKDIPREGQNESHDLSVKVQAGDIISAGGRFLIGAKKMSKALRWCKSVFKLYDHVWKQARPSDQNRERRPLSVDCFCFRSVLFSEKPSPKKIFYAAPEVFGME